MKLSTRTALTTAWAQSILYVLTGAWSLVDIDSFMAVTGPKVDVWLVRTVGALLTWTGCVLGWGARRNQISSDLAFIALGEALILALVDLVYTGVGRISRIYLLDAAAELALVALWILALRSGAKPANPRPSV